MWTPVSQWKVCGRISCLMFLSKCLVGIDEICIPLNIFKQLQEIHPYRSLCLVVTLAGVWAECEIETDKHKHNCNQEILIQTTLLCIYLVSKMKWSIGWRCQSKMKCFKIRSFNISSSKNILFHELLTWTSLKTLYLSFRSTPILDYVWTDVFILVFSIECLETETKVVIKVHKAK